MENMKAMDYEYLIRAAHNCGRYGVEGANADIYRTLETKSALLNTERENIETGKPREWNEKIEEMEFKYGFKCGEVATHVNIAINKVLKEHEDKLSEGQHEKLEGLKVLSNNVKIETLDSTIEEAWVIFKEIGLTA